MKELDWKEVGKEQQTWIQVLTPFLADSINEDTFCHLWTTESTSGTYLLVMSNDKINNKYLYKQESIHKEKYVEFLLLAIPYPLASETANTFLQRVPCLFVICIPSKTSLRLELETRDSDCNPNGFVIYILLQIYIWMMENKRT